MEIPNECGSGISHAEEDASGVKINLYSEETNGHQSRWNELKAQWDPPYVLRVT